jgi:hypothetical protein
MDVMGGSEGLMLELALFVDVEIGFEGSVEEGSSRVWIERVWRDVVRFLLVRSLC